MALALGPGISLAGWTPVCRIVMIGERAVRLEGGVRGLHRCARRQERSSPSCTPPHGDVRDIGTQFEVRARGTAFGVRARRRNPDQSRRRGDVGTRRRRLAPRSGRPHARSTIPVSGPEWAWTSTIAPQFQLEGGTVQQFLDWVAREQGWRWRFADSDTARRAAGIVTHGSLEGYRPKKPSRLSRQRAACRSCRTETRSS